MGNARPQHRPKYGNSGGNSKAIQSNSDPFMAIRASGGVPKPEKRGNSRPRQFAFIILQCLRSTGGRGFNAMRRGFHAIASRGARFQRNAARFPRNRERMGFRI